MNCHRISNLLSAYIDGELAGVEMIEIRRHLQECPSCQTELDSLRSTKRLLGRLKTAQPSADLAERICVSLDSVQPYSWVVAWSRFWNAPLQRLSPAVACVCVMFLGLLTFAATNINQTPELSRVDLAQERILVSTSPVSLNMNDVSAPSITPDTILSANLQNDVRHASPVVHFVDYTGP